MKKLSKTAVKEAFVSKDEKKEAEMTKDSISSCQKQVNLIKTFLRK